MSPPSSKMQHITDPLGLYFTMYSGYCKLINMTYYMELSDGLLLEKWSCHRHLLIAIQFYHFYGNDSCFICPSQKSLYSKFLLLLSTSHLNWNISDTSQIWCAQKRTLKPTLRPLHHCKECHSGTITLMWSWLCLLSHPTLNKPWWEVIQNKSNPSLHLLKCIALIKIPITSCL